METNRNQLRGVTIVGVILCLIGLVVGGGAYVLLGIGIGCIWGGLGTTVVKQCPQCAQSVPETALVCAFCGHRF